MLLTTDSLSTGNGLGTGTGTLNEFVINIG